jgi:putative ABC transport system substrate-binding protein
MLQSVQPGIAVQRTGGARATRRRQLSYGPDYTAIFRRLAEFVARILVGAKPADLPVEEPTILEFVVNQRIAKMIGVAIPQRALLRADVVIE